MFNFLTPEEFWNATVPAFQRKYKDDSTFLKLEFLGTVHHLLKRHIVVPSTHSSFFFIFNKIFI
ncbi:MAG: hypothetical protein DRN29_09360 [Thermoplasmata archaeon]|nr:MAG: hypothetical protein DRN29_09360 [Thermoplasmata archaeon]